MKRRALREEQRKEREESGINDDLGGTDNAKEKIPEKLLYPYEVRIRRSTVDHDSGITPLRNVGGEAIGANVTFNGA